MKKSTQLLICSLLFFVIATLCFNYFLTVNQSLEDNCKICSIFDKDCPYSTEELNEQEYGEGFCSGMGGYEVLWKLLLGGFFVSIFAGVHFMFNGVDELKEELKQKINKERK